VRLILALAALEGWFLSGLDVRNAYLYGELEEEIYMEQPEGFHARGKERHVLRLCHALYGLKQAGLAWWQALKKSMEELGFVNLDSDAGLFKCFDEASQTFIIAVVYVDVPCCFWVRSDRLNLAYNGNPRNRSRPSVRSIRTS